MVWCGKRGRRNHGRVRCCSCTSCRRRTITVRRSRTVAANRSWPTSAVRRSADSNESRFSSESPRTTSPITTGMARTASHSFWRGQIARWPIAANGDGTGPTRSATAQRQEERRDHGGHPSGQPQPAGQVAGADVEQPDERAGQRAAGRPRHQRARQPASRQLAGDGTDHGAGEGGEADLLQRGRQERPPAVDRGEEDVAHLGLLERQRPAPAARPQPDGDGQRGGDADGGRGQAAHVGQRGPGDLVVADRAGQEQHDEQADAAGQVGAVQRLEPLDARDAAALPVPPEVAQDGRRDDDRVGVGGEVGVRHCGATLLPALGRRAGGVGRPTRPRGHVEAGAPDAGAFEGEEVGAGRDARPAVADDLGVLPDAEVGEALPQRGASRKRPVSGSRLPAHGALPAPGMCPARRSIEPSSPAKRGADRASSTTASGSAAAVAISSWPAKRSAGQGRGRTVVGGRDTPSPASGGSGHACESAVQQGGRVADDAEHPDEAAGRAAAAVVVGDDDVVLADAETAQGGGELLR